MRMDFLPRDGQHVRARIATGAALFAALLSLLSGLLQTPAQAIASHAPLPSHTPNTLKVYQSLAGSPKQGTQAAPTISPRPDGTGHGTAPDKGPSGAGAIHIPSLSIPLDTYYLSTSPVNPATKQMTGGWLTNSDQSIALYLASRSINLSAASEASVTSGASAQATGSVAATPPSGPYTLQVVQTQGSYRGDSMTLAGFTLSILDGKGHAVSGARLTRLIQIRFNYGAEDLAGVNSADVWLVWPQTANAKKGTPPQAVPLTSDATAHTLTGTISTLYPGPMLLQAGISDANPASSEHPTVASNTGDLSLSIPLQIPPAAGGVQPNLALTYSSSGTNERDRDAPASAVGEGWDLSFGSISYDATTGLFYLNGAGGVNDALLCCIVDSAHGNTNYFMPHHDNTLHITTSDNSQHPNTTGGYFIVRTSDGTEYDFGMQPGTKRTTVTAGATSYYQWDLSRVIRRANTSSGYLQEYNITYWQDTATNSGITYVRDAFPQLIQYNYVNGSPTAEIYFNIHWPGATTTDTNSPAVATQYTTNTNCASSPLLATTLRCDDPLQPSGWEAPPLTMSTITLNSVFMQTWTGSSWQTAREYNFTYAKDAPATSCTDDVTGQNYACAGEHVLTSVQEIPWQNGSAMPSRQPIKFSYTAPTRDEYHDYTQTGFDSNPFDAQRTWDYLSGYTDKQTGAGETIQWKEAFGNSHGVPSGSSVTDPWACDLASCTHPDDRQWPRQTVASITDTATNLTTNYQYTLGQPCGSGCTEDTWIAPNAYNACNGHGQAPGSAMASCLISGPYTNYYNETFTGFAQVYITNPDGSTGYTQYYVGGGWGTNDWQFQNAYDGYAIVEDTYQGAATGTPLQEVDHQYSESNCPSIQSNGNQLFVNGYMMCLTYETQRDTYIGGTSSASSVPHLTQTWTYANGGGVALGMGYHTLTASSETTNDDLSDNFTNYGATQPTYTTNYTDVQHDGTMDATPSVYYFANLPAFVTLDDSAGNRWTCTQTRYDGQGPLTGQSTAIRYGLPTESTSWSNCGTSSNGYTLSGGRSATTGYDVYGQPVVTEDADAEAGDTTHLGCSAPSTLAVVNSSTTGTYTTCAVYDTTQEVYPTGSWNADFQESSATYDLAQGVETSATDANSVTTTYGGPVYEYNGSVSLANFQDEYTQTTEPGETLGGSSPWTTRVFTYSFCAAATGNKPCLEVDTVRNYDGSDTLVSRVFYDREGRQVETRTTGAIPGQDSVTITAYNDTADTTWTSMVCSVPTLTTSNGGRTSANTAHYIAPAQTSSGSGAYVDPATVSGSCASGTLTGTTSYSDALGRASATDDPIGTGVGTSGTGCLVAGSNYHHTTCVSYKPVVASAVSGLPSGDSEPYLQTVSVDANLHQSASYTDALGLDAYDQTLNGASQTPFGGGISSYGVTKNLYDPNGNLRQATDPLGHATKFSYDDTGILRSLNDPNRGAESYTYDSNGNAIETVDADGNGYAGTPPTTLGGDTTVEATQTTQAGQSAVATSFVATASGTADQVNFYLDASNRASQVVVGVYSDNAGHPGTLLAQATATSPRNGSWNTVNVSSISVTSGTRYWIALLGETAGTDTVYYRSTSTTNGDALDYSAQTTLAALPATWTSGGNSSGFHASAYLTQQGTTGVGPGITYAGYDGLNRQVWRNTTNSPTGAYDTYSYGTTSSNYTVGRLVSETFSDANVGGSHTGSYAYTYDQRGRTTATTETIGGTPYTTSSTYNDDDQQVSQTYPNGDVLTTQYTPSTGMESALGLTPSGGSQEWLLSNLVYSGTAGAAGLPSSATLGAITGGTASVSYSYDGLLRPTDTKYTYTPTGGSAQTLYEVKPTYDAVSNVSGETTTLPQGSDTQVFCYDAQDRLTWAGSAGTPTCSSSLTPGDTGSLASSGASYSASYSYDAANRLTSSPLGSYTYGDPAHVDAATAIGSSWTAAYDAAGNMNCRSVTSPTTCVGNSQNGAPMAYDNEGRLVTWGNTSGMQTAADHRVYDGAGNRVELQTWTNSGGFTYTYYIGGLEDVAITGSTTTTTAYYGGVALSVNGTLSYTLSDSLGSVTAAVSTSGVVTASQLYDPYGNVRYSNGTMPGSKAYTGQRADPIGLDYYGARYYDPEAGQFTSADDSMADGLNGYAYVGGNPETRTDPSGRREVAVTGATEDYSSWTALQQAQAQKAIYFSTWQKDLSDTADFFLGLHTLEHSYHTIFQDPHASAGDKWKAAGVGLLTLGTDALTIGSTLVGEPEIGEAARAGDVALDTTIDATLTTTVDTTLDTTVDTTLDTTLETTGDATGDGLGDVAGNCGGLSFAATTPVATPSGEQPIASLQVGEQVLAYDPTTGKQTTQTIKQVWLNHDSDRLDVTLALPQAQPTTASAATTTSPTADAETTRAQRAQVVAAHGLRAPPVAASATAPSATSTTATVVASATTDTEVIHTTSNHPWLTAAQGWQVAGDLRVGEAVRLLDGETATVVALHALPGVGAMWDLSLDSVHTFAVGDIQAVVHNCDFKTFWEKNSDVFESREEAKNAYNTLNRVKAGNPYKYPNADFENDGSVFANRRGTLPKQDPTYYREYTVPGPGTEPGADPMLNNRRIVTGRGGDAYYTTDHYRSFAKLWWPW